MVGNFLHYSIFFRYVKKLLHHDIMSHWTAANMICSKSSKYVHVYIILEISTEVLMGDPFMEYFKINDAKFRLASYISAVFE